MVLDEPFDAGPLTWIKPEIDLALGRALAAVQMYQESVKKGSADLTQFRFCRTHLHQVHGALSMADIDGLPMITEAEEDLLIALEEQKVTASESAIQAIFSANYAIEQYLNSLLAGEPPQPLKLAPILQRIEQAAGKSPSSASALFFPRQELKSPYLAPEKISETDKQNKLKLIRSQFQQGLLLWMQFAEKDGEAAKEKSKDGINKLRLSFESLIAISENPILQDYWRIAAAFCAVLASKEYISKNDAHRLCTLFDAQLRKMMQNSARINERHRRELLYYLASLPDGSDALSDQIRQVYRLGDYNLTSGKTSIAQITPETQQRLGDLNNCLRSAETTLGQYVGGSIPALGALLGFSKKINAICQQLNLQPLQKVATTLHDELTRLNELNALIPLHHSFEIAAAIRLINFAQFKYTEFVGDLNKEFTKAVDVLIQRFAHYSKVNSVQLSSPDQSVALLSDIFIQGKSRILAISLARKIQGILSNIEQLLDTYFRDTNNRENLPVAAEFLDKIINELKQIGKVQAANYLTVIQEKISELPTTKQSDKDFAIIAKNISRFGFYVDALLAGNTDVDFDQFNLGLGKKEQKPRALNSTEVTAAPAITTINQQNSFTTVASAPVMVTTLQPANKQTSDFAESNEHSTTKARGVISGSIISAIVAPATTLVNNTLDELDDLLLPSVDFTRNKSSPAEQSLAAKQIPSAPLPISSATPATTANEQMSKPPVANTLASSIVLPEANEKLAITTKAGNYFDQALQSLVSNFELDDVAVAKPKATIPPPDLSNSLGIDLDLVLLMDSNSPQSNLISNKRVKDDDSLGIDIDFDFYTPTTSGLAKAAATTAQAPASALHAVEGKLVSAHLAQASSAESQAAASPSTTILASTTQVPIGAYTQINPSIINQAPVINNEAAIPTVQQSAEITTTVANIKGSLFKKRPAASTPVTADASATNAAATSKTIASTTTATVTTTTTAVPVTRVEDIAHNQELVEIFLEEANEIIARLDNYYLIILKEPNHPTVLQDFRRGLHTLKGSGRTVGLVDFSTMAGSFEATLNEWLRTNEFKINFLHISFLNNICALLHQWLDYQKHDSEIPPDINAAVKQHPFFKVIPAVAPTTTASLVDLGNQFVVSDLSELEKNYVLEEGHGGAQITQVAESILVDKVFQAAQDNQDTQASELPTRGRGIKASIELPRFNVSSDNLVNSASSPDDLSNMASSIAQTKFIEQAKKSVKSGISVSVVGEMPASEELKSAGLSSALPVPPVIINTTSASGQNLQQKTTVRPVTTRHISPGLFAIFREEASDLLGTLQSGLALMNEIPGQSTPRGMIRAAHTLAGSSATVGLELAGQLTRAMEYALERRNQGDFAHSSNELLNTTLTKITQLIDLVNEPLSAELVIKVNELIDLLNKSYLIIDEANASKDRSKIITKDINVNANIASQVNSDLAANLASDITDDILENIQKKSNEQESLELAKAQENNQAAFTASAKDSNKIVTHSGNQEYDNLIDSMPLLDMSRKVNRDVVIDIEIPLPASAEEMVNNSQGKTKSRGIRASVATSKSAASTNINQQNKSALIQQTKANEENISKEADTQQEISQQRNPATKFVPIPEIDDVPTLNHDDELDAALAFPELLYEEDKLVTTSTNLKPVTYFPAQDSQKTDAATATSRAPSKITAVLTAEKLTSPFTLDVVGLKSGEIDPQMFEVFSEEAAELIANINQSIMLIKQGNYDAAADLLRILHTFKGAARMVGALNLGERAHSLESKLAKFLLKPPLSNPQISALQAENDIIATAIDNMRSNFANKNKPRAAASTIATTSMQPSISTSVIGPLTTIAPIIASTEAEKTITIATTSLAGQTTAENLITNTNLQIRSPATSSTEQNAAIFNPSKTRQIRSSTGRSSQVEQNITVNQQEKIAVPTTQQMITQQDFSHLEQFAPNTTSDKIKIPSTAAALTTSGKISYRPVAKKKEKVSSTSDLTTGRSDQQTQQSLSHAPANTDWQSQPQSDAIITTTIALLKSIEVHNNIANEGHQSGFVPNKLREQLLTISNALEELDVTTSVPSIASPKSSGAKGRPVIHSKVESFNLATTVNPADLTKEQKQQNLISDDNLSNNLNLDFSEVEKQLDQAIVNNSSETTWSSFGETEISSAAVPSATAQIAETALLTTTVSDNLQDFKTKLLETLRELEATAKSGALSAINSFENIARPQVVARAKVEKSKASIRVQLDKVDDLAFRSSEIAQAFGRTHDDVLQIKLALTELSSNVSRLRRHLDELSIQAASDNNTSKSVNNQFDSLEVERFSRLRETAQLIAESIEDIANVEHSLKHDISETHETLNHQKQLNRSLQDDIQALRVIPFSSIGDRLQRLVRVTSNELNKDVRLVIINADEGLDRSVLDRLLPALEHLLRNAITHGIESSEMRTNFGKNAQGKVTIKLTRHGNEIRIAVSDDGRGVDVVAIASKAESMGMLRAQHLNSRQSLLDLIFIPGFSTASDISELAGRGVGMDVVKTDVLSLGGRISLETQAGAGTVFYLNIPVNQSLQQALIIKNAEANFALSSTLVEQVIDRKNEELDKLRELGYVEWDNHQYPLFYLPLLLGQNIPPSTSRAHSHIILLGHGEQKLAIQVDHIVAHKEILVRPIAQLISSKQINNFNGIEGATILEQGQLALIINPLVLFQRALALEHNEEVFRSEIQQIQDQRLEKIAIMVVDDSLTVRKFSAKMLERAGYNVIVARDGDEAFHTLANLPDHQLPRVVLCDVDMPKRDGFDFLRAVKTDQRLRWLPVIMITSRTAEKHQNLAFELGASHYMGKPFVESELLDLLEQYANYPLSLNGIESGAANIIKQNFFAKDDAQLEAAAIEQIDEVTAIEETEQNEQLELAGQVNEEVPQSEFFAQIEQVEQVELVVQAEHFEENKLEFIENADAINLPHDTSNDTSKDASNDLTTFHLPEAVENLSIEEEWSTPNEELQPSPSQELQQYSNEEAQPSPSEEMLASPSEEMLASPSEEIQQITNVELQHTPNEEAHLPSHEEVQPSPSLEAQPFPNLEEQSYPSEEIHLFTSDENNSQSSSEKEQAQSSSEKLAEEEKRIKRINLANIQLPSLDFDLDFNEEVLVEETLDEPMNFSPISPEAINLANKSAIVNNEMRV